MFVDMERCQQTVEMVNTSRAQGKKMSKKCSRTVKDEIIVCDHQWKDVNTSVGGIKMRQTDSEQMSIRSWTVERCQRTVERCQRTVEICQRTVERQRTVRKMPTRSWTVKDVNTFVDSGKMSAMFVDSGKDVNTFGQ
ncbi:hypothetical protein AVEN_179694-1 [Araneus ventricosus]|uniref:Uncharacterized protein n=1 Tax=Araneus ventricosus TaxID=182803 RepID=A0A4Y2S9X1_ARAVE|nr:hypothetical protein AVEN_179694-1 [Araneus ventricosus]